MMRDEYLEFLELIKENSIVLDRNIKRVNELD